MNYGHFGKSYLCARKVKNLRAEGSKRDMAEETLYWTELPKFIPNPDFDNNGPMPADLSVSPVTSKPASRGRIKTGHSEVLYSYQDS
jgi:hypothetical protein